MKMFTLRLNFIFWFSLLTLCSRAQTDVLMQHNDLNRTGWNPNETILNTTNVTPTNFGLLYKHTVDDQIFAQPLIISGVNVTDPVTHNQVTRNLLIVVTVKNTMYAFDADDGTLDPYWQINFTPPGEIPPFAIDIHASQCGFTYVDFQSAGNQYGQQGSFGTVGTPAVDKSTNTLYFVSRYRDMIVDNAALGTNGTIYNFNLHLVDPDWSSIGFFQLVHAVDLSTGAEKFNGPVLIDPVSTYVLGTGVDADANNQIHFDPRRQNQRGGLFISNGIVYIPFSGHCDMDNYHGWILGYKLNDLSQQQVRYVTTPNNERGGIWMSGAAPAVDSSGNIYFAVGNGDNPSTSTIPQNMALSVVQAAPDLVNHTLTNLSWYKPIASTYTAWDFADLDFGTGVILIPGLNMLVTAHKSGQIMSMPRGIPAPGGAFDDSNPDFHAYNLNAGSNAQSHSSISYFGGSAHKYVYQFSENTHVMAFPVDSASRTLGTPVLNTSVPVNAYIEGGYHSVSSNGTDPSSAILWVTHLTGTTGGTMHALKADDITQELWNSDMNPSDLLGDYSKMSPPTIANGKVYVSTFDNALNVYGLLSSNSRCVTNVALHKYVSASNTDPANPASNAVDSNTSTRWAINGGTTPYLFVDLGGRYDLCKISVLWNNLDDNAHAFIVDITDDTLGVWTTIDSVTNNIFALGVPTINTFNAHSTARYVRMRVLPGGTGTFGVSMTEFQVFGSPANNCVSPALANMTVTNITENTATLGWNPVSGVTNYIVRYRPSFVSSYVTRNVQDLSGSGNPLHVDIIGLTCGYSYDFNIESDCGSGQLSNPNVITFNTSTCSSPCLNLTRWYSVDLGDVQVAGKTCYTAVTEQQETWTISGAGTGLGGNGDIFQINYTDFNTDGDFIASVQSQDALPASNQAGIMMRDSVSDISRYIFIGKTGDNQLVLIYRSAPGGMAITSFAPNPTNANYFRILKAGTIYTAFYGNSDTGPWTQMGPAAINLNFGTGTIKAGMGVSSTNPAAASTATFLILNNSIPLPIELLNFTAANVINEYVRLSWQTSMEENNDHFEVQRSSNTTDFKTIVSIKSLGNSSTRQSYSARDDAPIRGINYYRLKQVDTDSRMTYSATQKVKFGTEVAPIIYPNPVSSVFTAVSGKELIREIVIYNAQGRAVQFVMGNSTDDDLKVNVSLLPDGVYFLKVKTDSQIYQFKLIKKSM
jgi:hypothetical protein